MDLFAVKKFIGFILMPIPLIFILMLLAFIFFNASRSLARKCLGLATLMLFIVATPFFTVQISKRLETYPAFTKHEAKLDYIVVLGYGHNSDDSWPATSQLRDHSLERLVEAVRIYNLHPEATLITSGAAFKQNESNAEMVKQAAIILGVPEHKILTEPFPKDTEEEAALIAPRVAQSHFALVTSANHMARSVRYFQTFGAEPVPAPASPYLLGDKLASDRYHGLLPYANNIDVFTDAWHELLGQAWQWLKS